MDQKPEDELDDAETARRRDEVVKRMLATPPKPHKPKEPLKDGKPPSD